MDIFRAVFLGVVQGLTEFFPVSSSGHLVLAHEIWGGFQSEDLLFNILLHLGTLAAVLVFCRREVAMLLRAAFKIWRPVRDEVERAERRLLAVVFLASIPTAVFGLAIKLTIVGLFSQLLFLGLMFFITAAALLLSARLGGDKTESGALGALLIGTAQGIAVLPGISRSGATIVAALALGMEREAAARLAFTISIPAILGAALVELIGSRGPANFNIDLIFSGSCGIIAAALTGYLSLVLLTKIIKRARLNLFAYYCAAVGLLSFALSFLR